LVRMRSLLASPVGSEYASSNPFSARVPQGHRRRRGGLNFLDPEIVYDAETLVAIIESVRNRLTWSGMKRKNRAKCQLSLPFLPTASERSPSRRPRECHAPPPTRGFPTKTQATGSNHLGSSVLDHPAPRVVRLARSAGLCSARHGHPAAADAYGGYDAFFKDPARGRGRP
jgi:hypothetical protein